MAEGSSSSRMPRERAVSLLLVVQYLLEESNKVSVTGTSNAPNNGYSMQQGVQNASNGSSSHNNDYARQNNDSNRQGLIMQNFRNRFAGYSASSRNQSRLSQPPPAKRQKSGFYVPKEMLMHEFFCLADCAAESAPSCSEKLELHLASRGRKKIVFGSRDTCNAVKVYEKLEQAYPKLDKGDGFEILRSGAWFVRLEALSGDWLQWKFLKK